MNRTPTARRRAATPESGALAPRAGASPSREPVPAPRMTSRNSLLPQGEMRAK